MKSSVYIALKIGIPISSGLKKDENPDYQRMLPVAEYIKEDNRFSPPGIEWLYLSVGNEYNKAVLGSKAECRKNDHDRFASCLFEIENSYQDLMIADLTLADDISYEKINDRLEQSGQKYKSKQVRNSVKLGISTISRYARNGIKPEIEEWLFKTYLKLLSEQIFLPVEEHSNKKLIYMMVRNMN